MVCPECGMENSEELTVCAGCGKALSEPSAKSYAKDFAWASLVLGIVSMLIFPYLYGPLALIAGLISKKQGYTGKMATAGLILGGIALVGWIVTQLLSTF